jgi:hypothetical protein
MPAPATEHDRQLFQSLLAEARQLDPSIRTGQMFGCPAVFLGRRMVACVYGNSIGAKVPAPVASDSLDAGRATVFRPYGKPAMREWIQIDGGAAALRRRLDLLAAAIEFAASNNA